MFGECKCTLEFFTKLVRQRNKFDRLVPKLKKKNRDRSHDQTDNLNRERQIITCKTSQDQNRGNKHATEWLGSSYTQEWQTIALQCSEWNKVHLNLSNKVSVWVNWKQLHSIRLSIASVSESVCCDSVFMFMFSVAVIVWCVLWKAGRTGASRMGIRHTVCAC